MKKTMKKVLLLLTATVSMIACQKNTEEKSTDKSSTHQADDLNIYFGDLHNHCNITYGHGDMKDAFEAAKEQLDFVSVTPHAMWPDIPGKEDERLGWVIDYHVHAFDRLRAEGWPKYVAMTNEYNQEGRFVTFIGYEMHSMKYGDHVALNYDLDAPLVEGSSVPDLKEKLKDKKAFVTPHHMGYQEGFRGYNWDFFNAKGTPFVEIYSRHGLAEDDLGDYPNLHDMGPRNFEGTMLYGLNQGHKFGVIGSTDQHAGYPGSYGDGLAAIIAKENTREALWEAMEKRHVYCVTGDKIKLDFRINEAIMGDVIKGKKRNISVKVEGQNYIDYIDVIKNGERLTRINVPFVDEVPNEETVRAKVKVEFGWNRSEDPINWLGSLSISEGTIHSVTPCFRGSAFTAPQKDKIGKADLHKTLVNRIVNKTDKSVELNMFTKKNDNTLTSATQAVILDITMPKSALLTADFNGKQFSHTMEELLAGTKSHFMIGWLSEAIQFHRAAPESVYKTEFTLTDNKQEKDTDYYYVRVRQRDNNWAFSSAIWVEKE
jgi:hypothetical protein